jgi:hypothetical protein
MNKYQEAFEDLCITWDEEGMGKDHFKDQYPYLYNTIKELVDKETPMKVKPYPEFKKYFNIARCSKCERIVEIDDIYCRECGQKLDWSDSNAKD